MIDKLILQELRRLRKVQDRLEKLKPELDTAIDKLQSLYAILEQSEPQTPATPERKSDEAQATDERPAVPR